MASPTVLDGRLSTRCRCRSTVIRRRHMFSATDSHVPGRSCVWCCPQWCNQDFFSRPRPRLFLWCILEPTEKHFFLIFGRKRKCRRKWIPFTAENETKTRHSFSAEKRRSPDNISVFSFSYIQSPSQPYNAPPIPRPVSLLCRWSLTGFHFPRVQCTRGKCTLCVIFVAFL